MIIHGCTDDENLVAVDIPIHQFVSTEVDLCRIDLFDPNPIRFCVGGQRLSFSKLHDLSFLYRSGSQIVVGRYGQSGAVCYLGELDTLLNDGVLLSHVQVSKRPFADHFAEYLARYSNASFNMLNYGAGYLSQPDCVLPPFTASAAQLLGDQLKFGGEGFCQIHGPWSDPITFIGEMFSEVTLPAQLPDEITWVFQALSKWQPTVFGTAVRDALTGIRCGHREPVEILVGPNEGQAICQFLQQQYGVMLADGLPYRLLNQGFEYSISERRVGSTAAEWLRMNCHSYSVDAFWCSQPGEVRCSKIAEFDLRRRQTRVISGRRCNEGRGGKFLSHPERFRRSGYEVLQARARGLHPGNL